jgi:hypothetical protein
MPGATSLEISRQEQAQILAPMRRTRYGYLLAWHVLRLCAASRHPTEMAAFLLCSCYSNYRIACLHLAGGLVY